MKVNGPIWKPVPSSPMKSGISLPWMVRALNRISVRAVKMLRVPRVTMNGGRLNRTMRKPLRLLAKVETRIPTKTATAGFCPAMKVTLDAVV